MAHTLTQLLGKKVSIITCDGRNLCGILKGYDRATNLAVSECQEKIFSMVEGVEVIELGLFVIRGDNVSIVGEVDLESEAKVDLSSVRGEQVQPVKH